MNRSIDVWKSFLNNIQPSKQQDFQGLLSVKDNFDPNVFFNNVGVMYEAIGDTSMAKAYYIKSLGENILNVQAWINFMEVSTKKTEFLDTSIIPLIFYLSQSRSVLFALLSTVFIALFALLIKFHKKKITSKKFLIKCSLLSFAAIFLLSWGSQQHFSILKDSTKIYYGPSSLFFTGNKKEGGDIVFDLKTNNNFIKVFDFNSSHKVYWVKDKRRVRL